MNTRDRAAIELQVRTIIDSTTAGAKVEDSAVELKSQWPEPADGARLLAAHANASLGTPFLWVIGVKEGRGVVTFPPVDPATWIQRIESYFDGPAPRVADYLVRSESGPVVALRFDPDAPPYVIKYKGDDGRGGRTREVPWRELTSVRSATRNELLQLLVNTTEQATLQVLGATAFINERERDGTIATLNVRVEATSPSSDHPTLLFIAREQRLSIVVDGQPFEPNSLEFGDLVEPNHSVTCRPGSAMVSHHGAFDLICEIPIELHLIKRASVIELSASLVEHHTRKRMEFAEEMLLQHTRDYRALLNLKRSSWGDAVG